MKLQGRTSLVTGGNRGIGFEVCRQLGQQGSRIILGCRDLQRGVEAAQHLKGESLDVTPLLMDMASRDSIITSLREIAGPVDILINNAAILDHGSLYEQDDAELDYIIHTNLIGAILLAKHLSAAMKERNWGRIVNVSSGMGSLHRGLGSDSVAYRLSKLALNGLTISLAQSLRGTAVLVNSVDPGWVRTAMGGPMAHKTVEEGARGIVHAVLLPDRGPTGAFLRDGRRLDW